MTDEDLSQHSAVEAAAAIRDGRLTSRELVEACLARIDQVEPTVQAWQFLNRDYALAQADAADFAHKLNKPHGPLHGVPVGIKDIFNTRDMPTEDGSPIHAGRTPRDDAAAVARLRAAGAVVLGKTVTTEFAYYHPGKTANPRNAAHTPGGSSSGSAAAVAAGMVPLAIGSQTNGSTVRPAAFCGVVGYKPTHGSISRSGALQLSRTLDQVGIFARTVEDAGLMAECMIGFDEADPDTRPTATPPLAATAISAPPLPPHLAFVPSPVWDQAEAQTQAAFGELVDALGAQIHRLDLPSAFNNAVDWHRIIMETDMAVNLAPAYANAKDKLSAPMIECLERGRRHTAFDYARAIDMIPRLNELLEEPFFEFEAFVTPAAPGPAPAGLAATGSPIFNSIWTLCGVPAVTIPLLRSESGMPIGVQLVGKRGDDARLLRTAHWLMTQNLE